MYRLTFYEENDAKKCLYRLNDLIIKKGRVSLYDIHKASGAETSDGERNIGFTDISGATVAYDAEYKCYMLKLPDLLEFTTGKPPISNLCEDSNVTRHANICKELNELYERKNHDYGDAFHDTFIEEGFAMARIRLTDKLSRFKTLSKSGERAVTDESIRDTLIDLANYAIMTVMEMDRNGTK